MSEPAKAIVPVGGPIMARPAWCCGALLPGGKKDRGKRVRCGNEALTKRVTTEGGFTYVVAYGLCTGCAALEQDARRAKTEIKSEW